MKLPTRKFLFYGIGTLSVMAFVWYFGSLFSFAQVTPLASSSTRIIAMFSVAALAWILYHREQNNDSQLPSTTSRKKNKPARSASAMKSYGKSVDVNSKSHGQLGKLQEHFKGAIEFLRKTPVKKSHGQKTKSKLFNLPWFLVLGGPGSGKSSLLTHSGLRFLLAKKLKKAPASMTMTRYCDWWGTQDAVFLDTPGDFVVHDKANKRLHFYWLDFLSLLSKHRYPPLNGVILTFSLEKIALQNSEEQNIQFSTIRRRLQEIQKKLGTAFPLYIVFTHADCLAGFNDFFDHLDQDARGQVWGITFNRSQISDSQRIAENFDTEFDEFLKRLNQLVIPRLHQERNKDKRASISDFPLQMESLKKNIVCLLQQIAPIATHKHLSRLRGLYFTSAIPKNDTVDRLLAPLRRMFPVENAMNKAPLIYRKSFFTKQLFKKVIFQDAEFFDEHHGIAPRNWRGLRIAAASVATLLLTLCIMVWTRHFSDNVVQINYVEEAVVQYRLLAGSADLKAYGNKLMALDLLAQATHVLQKSQILWPLHLGKQQQVTLYNTAQRAYYHSVQQLAANTLKQVIQQETQRGQQADCEKLYGALKAYLMLGDAQRFNPEFIYHWLSTYWLGQASFNSEIDDKTVRSLQSHAQMIFKYTFKPIGLNQSVVKQARTVLNQLPIADLTFVILNNDFVKKVPAYQLKVPSIQDELKIFTVKNDHFTVPGIYTAQNFALTYDELIPEAAKAVTKGSWVLGQSQQPSRVQASEQAIAQARQFYIKGYIDFWQGFIDKLTIADFNNLEEAVQIVDSLIQVKSPVNRLLKSIDKNTHVAYKETPTPISIHFQKLNRYLDAGDLGLLAVRSNLVEMQDYLVNIVNDKDPNGAAFVAAKIRMSTDNKDILQNMRAQAELAPAPINEWLNKISTQSWALILNQSGNHVQRVWREQVWPEYSVTIADRYPIDAKAKQEIGVNDFNRFFSPKGSLDRFFTNYLAPFIDASQPMWHWRKMESYGIGLNEDSLAQFQRALLIKTIYFPNDSKEFSLAFRLIPEALQPIVKSFSISLDDHEVTYTQTKQSASELRWPTPAPIHSVNLQFTSIDGHQVSANESGDWAWFKILNQSGMEATTDPKQLHLTFDINGYGARFFIASDAPLNPFSTDLLPHFRVPKDL